MARVHQLLVLTVVSGSALYSGLVPALGLGDIDLHSALNQPLSAEIELLDVGDLTRDEIKVRLASQSAFDQSGVDRPFFLNDLRFTPVLRGKTSVVRVVSTQPVREPYLNFIVEVARPGGTLLREYTLLLDPPDSPYLASAAPAPSAAAAPSRAARASAAPAVRSAPPAAPAPSGPLPAAVQGKRYRVASGDSLWAIARRFNPGGEAALEGLMRDIQLLNPHAFVGGEAHRLKVGAELLLPDSLADEAPPAVLSLSSEDEELKNTRPSAPVPSVPGSPESQAALQRRVDEELASSTGESQSLQQQMRELQNQLQILQQQLSEKDQQLASLESRLGATPATVPQTAAPAPVEPSPSGDTPADGPDQPETPPADAVAPLDDQASAVAPQAESEPALPPADTAQTAPAQTSAAAEPAPAAPIVEEPAAEQPAAEAEQPTGPSIWLIGAFCLVMLLALLLLLRRRRKPARLPDPQVVVVPVVEDNALVSPARVRGAASVEPPAEARTQISTDPLEAANIYIAYGRFGEAESTLRHALENAPARMDLRLRLLEVLAENGDLGGFAREEAVLREMGASPAQLERIKTRYPAMSADADALAAADSRVDPLQDAVLDLDDLPPAPVAHVAPDVSANDYPLNLDDLSLDADWDLINPFPNQSSRAAQGKAEVEEEADFHSNLQELPEVYELEEPQQPSARSGFEADLSDDFLDAFADDLSSERPLDDLTASRKMSLAMTYIEQGEIQSACNILNEVIDQGDEQQKEEARELLSRIA